MANCCTDYVIVEKSVNKQTAIVGDILTYSVAVINQSDFTINDIVVIDALPPELEFVEGSIMLGCETLVDDSMLTGVCIGSLSPGGMKVITFEAKVIGRPFGGMIKNKALIKFKCRKMTDGSMSAIDATSNTASVKIEIASIDVIKQTTATIVSRGDLVEYTVKLVNTGTLEAKNILFTDIIGAKNILIEETFKVDGKLTSVDVQAIPEGGKQIEAYVGSILPGEAIIITYKVQVLGINCRGYVINKAYATFSYNLPGGTCAEVTSELDDESTNYVELGLSTFKQLSMDGYLTIPEVKPDMEGVNDVSATADLINCHVIQTPVSISTEGQSLSGYKLIVKGMLHISVEYTANEPEQGVHSAHYAIPFSSFIVLPEDYVVGSKIDVEFIIEDIYYKMIDVRTLFKNITLLINVKILSC